jgi:hypothetical protein
MKQITKIALTLLLVVFGGLQAFADDVEFRASAPSQVIIGKPFQLTYSVNQRAKDLQAPEFADFDYLAGPYTSQSSSTSFINGKRTSSFTLTYTYTLMANKEGTFTLPPATITVDREQYSSNGLRITVLPADEQPAGNQPAQSSQAAQRSGNSGQASANTQTSSENIFIRTIVTKTKVHEQEALLLSYKLYFAGVDVAQFTNNTKLPDFTGFLKQELEQGDIQTELEHYNGRNYQTAVLYRTLLYPQHSGDIKIDPANFEAVLRVQTRAQVRSIFDDFFGSYTNVTKPLVAPGVTIHVEALPAGKPAGFSGGVGSFTMASTLSATDIQANEAVTIKIDIKGSGNMKLLKTPAIDWPEGFEAYDPKVTNNFKTTAAGVSGTKQIEYLAIPRAGGDYTIPPIKYSYFDIQENAYKTLTTPEYTIHVQRGASDSENSPVVQNYVNKEDVKQFGSDIRYIHVNDNIDKTPHKTLLVYGSLEYWLCFIIPFCIATLLLILFRKRIKENADITRVRYKKANKVAQKRLKTAKKLMAENNKTAFYEEIERAALSYLSDRLAIPTADLSKENIAQILRDKHIAEELITNVNSLLTTAEFARYAPSADSQMQELYNQTTEIINTLENQKL